MKDEQRLLDAGAIAPLHRACAERALTHCPHLKGMPDRELKAFPRRLDHRHPGRRGPAGRPTSPTCRRSSVVAITFLQLIGVPDLRRLNITTRSEHYTAFR